DELVAFESPKDRSLDDSDRLNQTRFSRIPLLHTVAQTSAEEQPSSSGVDASSLAWDNSEKPLREQIMCAAHQSRAHSENAEMDKMSDVTLEEITAEVERLTKEQVYVDPLSTFPDIVRTRDQIYRLLEQRQYPDQTTHLYYLASIVCALLSNASASVGLMEAAVNQARASGVYAEIIGHNSLRLESRRMRAGIAYWDNRPQRALELALSAVEWATEPLARAALYSAIALFSALTARPDQSRAALATAFEAQESSAGHSDLYDRLRGRFGYSRAKLLQD